MFERKSGVLTISTLLLGNLLQSCTPANKAPPEPAGLVSLPAASLAFQKTAEGVAFLYQDGKFDFLPVAP